MTIQIWLVALLCLGALCVALFRTHAFKQFMLRRKTDRFVASARQLIDAVRERYPDSEHVMAALTTEPNLRQASSAYKNITMEDYLDAIDRTEPHQTPVFSMARTETDLGNTESAWNVDEWPSPKGALGVADNEDVASGDIRDRAQSIRKMGNYMQGARRPYGAGWIAQRVPKIAGLGRGGKSLWDSEADAAVLLKQDFEVAMCSHDQTAYQDTGSGNGGLMAGIVQLAASGNAYAAASAYAPGKATDVHSIAANAAVTGAASAVHTQAMWKTVSKALRTHTKHNGDYMAVLGVDLRQLVSDLTDPTQASASAGALAPSQVRVRTRDEDDATLGVKVDVIQTSFGKFLVTDTSLMGTTTTTASGGAVANSADRSTRAFVEKPLYGIIFPMRKNGMLFKRWGVAPFSEKLSQTGGGDKFDYKGALTLGVRNPKYFGYLQLT